MKKLHKMITNIKSTQASWDKSWITYNQKKYENQLALEESRVRWQRIKEIIIKRFGSFNGLNCIEIGAGSGHYSMLFARHGAQVTLLDYSTAALNLSRSIFKSYKIDMQKVNFIKMDALQIDQTLYNTYNISMSFGVAEHFRSDDKINIVKAHYNVLKNGGMTFISVPNAHCYPYRLYRFIIQLLKQKQIECYPYSRKEFLSIADKCSFKDCHFIGFSYKETFDPFAFYRRRKGIVQDISKIKMQKPNFLDQYLGRGIIFCGFKKTNSLLKEDTLSKILIVGPASPSTGGIPSYIDNLLASSLKEIFKLELYDPLIIKNRSEKQESHISLKELFLGLKALILFIKNIRKKNLAMVHIHTSSFWGFYEKALMLLLAKYVFKKKALFHIHGGLFDQFIKQSKCKFFIRWLINQADKTLMVSRRIKEELNLANVIHVDNCTYFGNNLFFGDKSILREKYNIPINKIIFLSLGLLLGKKGIYETLEVFRCIHKKRKDFYFIIAGEGPEKESLADFVEQHNLSPYIKIMDFISAQMKNDILHLSDVFILNSTVESFGISLIEAISHGLFVITTPVGIALPVEDVFRDGNCIRIPIGDNAAHEKAIIEILDKRIDITKVKEKNFYDFKARFDVQPVFEKMRLIYEDVLRAN